MKAIYLKGIKNTNYRLTYTFWKMPKWIFQFCSNTTTKLMLIFFVSYYYSFNYKVYNLICKNWHSGHCYCKYNSNNMYPHYFIKLIL